MKKIILISILTIAPFVISCSDDDNTSNPIDTINPKEYKIQFWGSSSSEIQYPLTVTYYKDNQNGTLVSEQVSSQTNTDVIESRTISSYDKLGFKLTVANGGQALVNTVIITEVESNEVIFEDYSLQVNTGETYMYDISDDAYIIQ